MHSTYLTRSGLEKGKTGTHHAVHPTRHRSTRFSSNEQLRYWVGRTSTRYSSMQATTRLRSRIRTATLAKTSKTTETELPCRPPRPPRRPGTRRRRQRAAGAPRVTRTATVGRTMGSVGSVGDTEGDRRKNGVVLPGSFSGRGGGARSESCRARRNTSRGGRRRMRKRSWMDSPTRNNSCSVNGN